MIYQFTQYLKTALPTEIIYANQRFKTSSQEVVPDRCVLCRETVSNVTSWFRWAVQSIQVNCRDKSITGARELAFQVYDLLKDTYGLELPTVVVDGDTYAAEQIPEIVANNRPQSVGQDEDGRTNFIINFSLFYKE